MHLSDQDVQNIISHLKNKISPDLVILFGSSAKGIMREDSDIDIAFLSRNEYDDYQLFIISQELASILGKEVDLIDLNKASTVFQAQIIGKGKVIYCKDKCKKMYFEMYVLKKYARLNEERKCILEDIKKRGAVYGD